MNYTDKWDLSSIPEESFKSEAGRRRRLKGPTRTYVKLKPCKCGILRTASERRDTNCPRCGHKEGRRKNAE